MRNLINFIIKNTHWFLFVFLVVISCFLIVRENGYQRSIYLSSANEVTGKIYSLSNTITSYIGLKTANEDLTERIAELETKIRYLEDYIWEHRDSIHPAPIHSESGNQAAYIYLKAKVVNNSVSGMGNYITLNKGKKEGIAPDMGVISATGIVGVVSVVSDNFSVVIPVLNPKFKINCRVKSSNHFGPLTWDGDSPRYAYLEELPRHVTFNIGDTIVTSGYSLIFPEGIMVGIVSDSKKQKDDNFNSLQVELSTDFSSLNEVLVIKNKNQAEQKLIEREAMKHVQ